MTNAAEFLKKHRMSPEQVNPAFYAGKMKEDMEAGLRGDKSFMPMIPTYIKTDGEIVKNRPVIVIDAGGTNFRCGLAEFTDEGCEVSGIEKYKMPGIDTPATWEEFISFIADKIQPFAEKTDTIGFCFSYNAEITPEIDGKVIRIDKEVVIKDCEGKLVGKTLSEELAGRGFPGKRVFVLNDTVAALLGASYKLDKSKYSGFIGQICGTGANTCCVLPYSRIEKLERTGDVSILINLESGLYAGFEQGDFDTVLDDNSINSGEKILEKMVSGVYLGELGRLCLVSAADEGYLSEEAGRRIKAMEHVETYVLDAWASERDLEMVCDTEEDREFVAELSTALFDRAARFICANLAGIMLLTGEGKDKNKPVCICAEGSLVDKSRYFRPFLEEHLKKYAEEELGLYSELHIGYETTLPGSAAAALLNI